MPVVAWPSSPTCICYSQQLMALAWSTGTGWWAIVARTDVASIVASLGVIKPMVDTTTQYLSNQETAALLVATTLTPMFLIFHLVAPKHMLKTCNNLSLPQIKHNMTNARLKLGSQRLHWYSGSICSALLEFCIAWLLTLCISQAISATYSLHFGEGLLTVTTPTISTHEIGPYF